MRSTQMVCYFWKISSVPLTSMHNSISLYAIPWNSTASAEWSHHAGQTSFHLCCGSCFYSDIRCTNNYCRTSMQYILYTTLCAQYALSNTASVIVSSVNTSLHVCKARGECIHHIPRWSGCPYLGRATELAKFLHSCMLFNSNC